MKHLLPVLLLVCTRRDDGSDASGHRLMALDRLVKADHIVCSGGMFLASESADDVKTYYFDFLMHYRALTQIYVDRGELLYHIAPKFHYCIHMCIHAVYMNPRITW